MARCLMVILITLMLAPGFLAAQTAKEIVLPGGVKIGFVIIGPGTFQMGSPKSEKGRYEHEGPRHKVRIPRLLFYIGQYEVTQSQWEAVMGNRPWEGKNFVQEHPDHPAVYVSWNDVQAFAQKLNQDAGEFEFRLPTEAEWEYVCRAGTDKLWSFGNDGKLLKDHAWYEENAWNVEEKYGHAVGTKLPSPWGLYDMHGNVMEWVQDWFGPYGDGDQTDPNGPEYASLRTFRGGGFSNTRALRSAWRGAGAPAFKSGRVGFRLVMEAR